MLLNLKKYIGAVAYPTGSIYCTTKDIDPATIWGGTWERLQGKFLFGTDDSHALGSTGGEENHKLIVSEMPNHTHTFERNPIRWSEVTAGSSAFYTSDNVGASYTATSYSTGGNLSHNNMPPYQVVNMWIRTALRGGVYKIMYFCKRFMEKRTLSYSTV